MRSRFSHHYERPTDDEVNAALREGTVVLDTNVLLSLYRASAELREKRLEVLKTIGSSYPTRWARSSIATAAT